MRFRSGLRPVRSSTTASGSSNLYRCAMIVNGALPQALPKDSSPLASRFYVVNDAAPVFDWGGFLCIFRFSLFTFHYSLGLFIMGECSVIFFILFPNVYFSWARGASSREQPKEERGMARKLAFPLSPLGFSLELPFPHSLSPLGRESLVWRKLLGGSAV